RFLGLQDTLLPQTGRQLFENCYIAGGVDFIFGGSTAVFDRCHIHSLRDGFVTAASTPKDQQFGYVFLNCKLTAENDSVKVALGRPWRADASVTYINTEMPANIRPAGWNNWNNPAREKTARYAEFNSTGPGANPAARVPWSKQLSESEAKQYTIENVLGGIDGWDPKTGAVRQAVKVVAAQKPPAVLTTPEGDRKYLFLSGGDDGLKLTDGTHARTVMPEIKPVRDPSLLIGADNLVHLVWTGSADAKAISYASSKDLIHWSPPKQIDVMSDRKDVLSVSAPELFYDDRKGGYFILWSATLAGNFFQSYQDPVNDNPRLWYTTTRDFETFAPSQLSFDPGYGVTDGFILKVGEKYALLHRDNRRIMQQQDIRVAMSDSPTGPWGPSSDRFLIGRAPCALRDEKSGEWLIATDGGEAVATRDFFTFTPVTLGRTFCGILLTPAALANGLFDGGDAPRSDLSKPASEMADAAMKFYEALAPELQSKSTFDFQNAERQNWAFVPRARQGIPFKQMSPQQRELAKALLKTGLSQRGYEKADSIMNDVESALRDLEGGNARRDSELYFFTLFGNPKSDQVWGWRFEGHHLSLNFTIVNGKGIASSPAFMGAHPANVTEGPHKGMRVLGTEEDLGRKLIKSLNDDQRKSAIFLETAPRDIVTGNSRKLDPMKPAGIPASQLSEDQKKQLLELIGEYAHRLRPELAEQDLQKINTAGIEKVFFAWAGGLEPGQGHYYRIQGPTFMIEYDNTQDDANHIHSVWRDPENDFGEDLLKKHYEQHAHDHQ
ncbi:MAG TPA: pectinesterase family protein, partial [Tepidisphaeraceae bacterium]